MKYIADDGKIFDTARECENYERKLILKENGVKKCIFLFTMEHGYLERTVNIDFANFALIKEDIEYSLIDDYFDEYDCISEGLNRGKGIYKWDGDKIKWIKIQSIIDNYHEEIEKLNKKINEMVKIEQQIMSKAITAMDELFMIDNIYKCLVGYAEQNGNGSSLCMSPDSDFVKVHEYLMYLEYAVGSSLSKTERDEVIAIRGFCYRSENIILDMTAYDELNMLANISVMVRRFFSEINCDRTPFKSEWTSDFGSYSEITNYLEDKKVGLLPHLLDDELKKAEVNFDDLEKFNNWVKNSHGS